MIVTLGILLLLISLVYSLFFLYLASKTGSPVKPFKEKTSDELFVTILVPLRNEAANVSTLLKGLLSQDYDISLYEIILIDDHSEDYTLTMIKEAAKMHSQVLFSTLPEDVKGKKQAIRHGIHMARGSFIMTTDADCKVPEGWISSAVAFYKKTGAQLIIGPVKIATNPQPGWFEKLQALEFTSLVGTGASMAEIGKPVLCNGANMAFEKAVYPPEPSALVPGTPSGDDIFLLQYVKRSCPGNIRFNYSEEAVVTTNPASGPYDFMQQRKRWLSKGKYYRDPEIFTLTGLVGLMNLSLLTSVLIAAYTRSAILLPVVIFLLKTITDSIFLYPWLRFYKQTYLKGYILLIEAIYPFYMILTGLMAITGKTVWKNRRYSL